MLLGLLTLLMEPWMALLVAVVALIGAVATVHHRRSPARSGDVVMRIDIGRDPNVPLAVVNAGRDPVFEVEATLRFEPRAPRSDHVMERHRRALVLLPGERLAFPLPEDMAGRRAAEHASLVRRVRLDAIARDATGRSVHAHDLLEDPLTWLESERRSRSAVMGTGTPHGRDR
jgi:hypothetical protein